MLILPHRFAERQPTGICGVRRNNPLTIGLTGLINGRRGIGVPRDLVNRAILPVATGGSTSADSIGYGQRTHGYNGALTTNRIGTIGQLGHWLPTNVNGFSVFVCFDMLEFTAGTSAQIFGDAAGKWGFFNSAGGTGAWSAYFSTAASNITYSSAPFILKLGQRNVFGMTLDATNFCVYLNGVRVSTASTVGGTTTTYHPTFARVQFAGGLDQYGAATCLLWAGIWNRTLIKEEARSLYEEKYQLLEQQPDRLWFPVTAPGIYVPTLSSPNVINITSTSVTPVVTITI